LFKIHRSPLVAGWGWTLAFVTAREPSRAAAGALLSLAAVNISKGLAMTDEIAALRREVAELRQAVSGMRARVEVLELREQLRELQHPKFMPYQFVGPDGRGWAAAYCPIELWPGIAASAVLRAH
jgi:hypothetical protein